MPEGNFIRSLGQLLAVEIAHSLLCLAHLPHNFQVLGSNVGSVEFACFPHACLGVYLGSMFYSVNDCLHVRLAGN